MQAVGRPCARFRPDHGDAVLQAQRPVKSLKPYRVADFASHRVYSFSPAFHETHVKPNASRREGRWQATMDVVQASSAYDCIYCRRRLPEQEFNREHVLSTAFGGFTNALVLHTSVCRECNQFLGDELETRVARGAFEGMLRYKQGVKKPDTGEIKMRYVEFTVPDGTNWAGVRLGLAWRDAGLVVNLIPQVAFFNATQSRWVHITADEIERGLLAGTSNLDTRAARMYAGSKEELDLILSRLARFGITFAKLDDMSPPHGLFDGSDISVEVGFTINKGIRRCMAKYAFNYLAFVCGTTFALEADFNTVRRFIRYGDMPSYPIVVERFGPILRDDSQARRQTSGHLLTLDWAASGFDLVGQVSLFNSITYSISLARHYSGLIWRPIRSGLHFDIRKKRIQPLTSISQTLLPR